MIEGRGGSEAEFVNRLPPICVCARIHARVLLGKYGGRGCFMRATIYLACVLEYGVWSARRICHEENEVTEGGISPPRSPRTVRNDLMVTLLAKRAHHTRKITNEDANTHVHTTRAVAKHTQRIRKLRTKMQTRSCTQRAQ